MSKKIYKHITLKNICTDCQDVFYKENIPVLVQEDFKVSDIKKLLPIPVKNCPSCNKKSVAKFSFYHEEKIN